MSNTDILLIVMFLLMFSWSEWLHKKERADLYTRLMSKDVYEYKDAIKPQVDDEEGTSNFILNRVNKIKEEHSTTFF